MPEDSYVTNGAWLAGTGRPDAIDEVADQFERPTLTHSAAGDAHASGAGAFWDDITARRLARITTLAPRTLERRAG